MSQQTAHELTPEDRREIVEFAQSAMQIHQQSEDPDNADVSELHDSLLPVLAQVRVAARRCGYAVGWHGSMARDIDMIAVPWVEHALPPEEMVAHVVKCVRGWLRPSETNPQRRPHGRLSWAIHLIGTGTYIDLSVMPLLASEPQPQEAA